MMMVPVFKLFAVLLVVVTTGVCTSGHASTLPSICVNKTLQECYRKFVSLLENQRPTYYNMRLYIRRYEPTFSGRILIAMRVLEATDTLVFHQRHLMIDSVTCYLDDPTLMLNNSECGGFDEMELYYLKLDHHIQPNQIIHLDIIWRGTRNWKPQGIYKRVYHDHEMTRHILYSSQLDETNVRQVFPCMDNPKYRVPVYITIQVPKGNRIIFTQPPEDSPVHNNSNCWDVAECEIRSFDVQRFSVNLLQFVSGDIYDIQATSRSGKQITLYYVKRPRHEFRYALNITVELVNFYEDYFSMSHPLPHLGIFATPYDDGVMERPGLSIVQESSLRCNALTSSKKQRHKVLEVLSYIVAHEWFAYYGTIQGWGQQWMLKGFARYVTPFGMHHIDSSIDIDGVFDSYRRQGLPGSSLPCRPFNAFSPTRKIKGLFHSNIYKLVAAIFRMFQNALGEETLRVKLGEYLLAAHADQMVHPSHHHLSNVFNATWLTRFQSWLNNRGHPVLTLTNIIGSWPPAVKIQSQQFLLHKKMPGKRYLCLTEHHGEWFIPFTYMTSHEVRHRKFFMVRTNHTTYETPNFGKPDWILANVDGKGVYRVNYEEENWLKLHDQLVENYTVFSPAGRRSLLDDAFSLARVGQLKYEIAFRMLHYLTREQDAGVWRTALSHLGFIGERLLYEEEYRLFETYLRNHLVHPKLRQLGWEHVGDENTRRLRMMLIPLAAKARNQTYTDYLNTTYKAWKENPNIAAIPREARQHVFDYAMDSGTDEDRDYMLNKAQQYDKVTRGHLLTALSKSCRQGQVHRLLTELTKTRRGRLRHSSHVMKYVSNNPYNRLEAWLFVKASFAQLVNTTRRFSLSLLSHFDNHFSCEEFRSFFRPYWAAGLVGDEANRGVIECESNAAWMASDRLDQVKRWLRSTVKHWTTCQNAYYPFPVHNTMAWHVN